MTTLIQQLSGNDCVLASIAMAKGCLAWHDLWTDADLAEVVKSQGVGDAGPWLKRAGWDLAEHYRVRYIHEAYQDQVKGMLWKRRALLTCHSLNLPSGSHMVFWDGDIVWDPSRARTYKHLHSMILSQVILFAT